MKILIAGCGRVGALLANRLSTDNHDVGVIDHDKLAFSRLARGFAGSTHIGKAFDHNTLVAAGVEHADAFIAVTSGDNSNVVSAMVAKEVFRVPRVVSRIYDPRRAEIYRRLGIKAVSSVSWSVNEALALLVHPDLSTACSFGDGDVRMLSVEIPPRLAGRSVVELGRDSEIMPVSIVRAGTSFLPSPGATFNDGDLLYVAVSATGLAHLERMLEP